MSSSILASGTGLSTGIDYSTLIPKLMELERAPETVLQNKISTINTKKSAMTTILGKLTSLKSLAADMNTPATFMAKTVDVSDSTAAKATVSSTALQGTHQIKITQLAQPQIQVSAGYAASSDTAAFAAGSFTITSSATGATPVTVTLTASTSLEGFAAAINSSNPGVTASVMNDGSSPNPYRLVITGNDSYTYSFDFTGYSTSPTLSETQAAKTAQFSVDGVNVVKASNTITDVIPGVTFTLLQGPSGVATTKDFTLAVNNDTAAVKKKINDFVTAYNAVMYEIKGQSDYNATTKKGGTLSGNSTLRTVQSQLQSILTTPVSGITGQYTILSSIGIATQKDGSLKVDDTKLTDALNNKFNDVADLFTRNSDVYGLAVNEYGVAEQFDQVLESLTRDYIGPNYDKNGLVTTSIHGMEETVNGINDQIDAMEVRMTQVEENLKKQFTSLETLVSSLQTQGNAMLSILGSMSSSWSA